MEAVCSVVSFSKKQTSEEEKVPIDPIVDEQEDKSWDEIFKHVGKRRWVFMEIVQIVVLNDSSKDLNEVYHKMEKELELGTKTLTQMLEETFERGFQAHLPLRGFYAEMKKSGLDLEAKE